MPVILPPDGYARWLDPTPGDSVALRPLLVPFPAGAMTARPVSTAVNDARFDDRACLDPEEQPPLPLG
jgi:putative SOS response-associated peptidase YedK